MLVTEFGISMLARAWQPINVPSPMLVTESGIVMLASFKQLSNALLSMLVTALFKLTSSLNVYLFWLVVMYHSLLLALAANVLMFETLTVNSPASAYSCVF